MATLRYDAPRGHDREGGTGAGETLSIVVPAKDEAASLPGLLGEVVRWFRPLPLPWPGRPRLAGFEVLIIDDGSTDGTPAVLSRLARDYPELRPIRLLMRNVGQSAAGPSPASAWRVGSGSRSSTLTPPPRTVPRTSPPSGTPCPATTPRLGWRTSREDVRPSRIISRWNNHVRNLVLGQSIRDTGCSVRIFRREMALRLPTFHGMHRFLGPLLLREGVRVVQVPVTHRPRSHGRSHYNLRNRLLRIVVDLLGVAWLCRRTIRYEVVHGLGGSIPRPHFSSRRNSCEAAGWREVA